MRSILKLSTKMLWITCSSCAVLGANGNAAYAQTGENASPAVDDIIVTAQKREQSVQDVGIAISVLNSDALTVRGITQVADVGIHIPNVQVNFASDTVSMNVRGIGQSEFATNFDPPVAINVDEVYFSKTFMTGLLLFDIDRVETLKGPQGTLFGRNATGGAVNLYTRKPTDRFQSGGTIGYDNYRTLRTEAHVSGPVTRNLSFRISGMYNHQGKGFYRNLILGTRDGKEQRGAVRGQLKWDDGVTTAHLTLSFGKDTSVYAPYEGVGVFTPESLAAGAPMFCPAYLAGRATGADPNCVRLLDARNPGDNDPYTSTNNLRHKADSEGYGAVFRLEHDLGSSTLTSISSYQHFRRQFQGDSDATPTPTIDEYWRAHIDQFSQELRLGGNMGGWNYVLGGYYEHDNFKSRDFLAIFGGAAPGFYSPTHQRVDALAAFFHNEVGVTGNLKLIAGMRYTKEKVSIDSSTFAFTGVSGAKIPAPETIVALLAASDALPNGDSQTHNAVTYKIGVEWAPPIASPVVDKMMMYGHISTGFRTGGFNSEFAASQSAFTELSAENLTAYEAGLKSTLFDRKVTANLALFHYDFSDGFINVDSATSPVPVTINAANIKSYGAEFELSLRPVSGLSINNTVGWLDSKIASRISSGGQSLFNNRTINSPRWSYAVDANYEVPLSGKLKLAASVNANWRSSQFLEAANTPNSREGGYWLLGGRIAIGADDDRWSLSLWGKNLTKSVYRTYVNDLPGFGFLLNVYGQPRTYGASLSFQF